MGKEHLHARLPAQMRMLSHLPALVVGQTEVRGRVKLLPNGPSVLGRPFGFVVLFGVIALMRMSMI